MISDWSLSRYVWSCYVWLGAIKDGRHKKAADGGDESAYYFVGIAYEKGLGVTKDINKAKKWFELSASHGDILAKGRLKQLPI